MTTLLLSLLLLSLTPGLAGAVTGTVDVFHADLLTGKAQHWTYFRPDTGGRHLVASGPRPYRSDLQDGDRAQGTRAKGKAGWAVQPLMTRAPLLPAVVAGNRTLAVILLDFTDAPAPTWLTQAGIRRGIFEDPLSVAAWFRDVSYGRMTFTGEVYGPYTLPISGVGCPYPQAASYGDQALKAQIGATAFAAYQHILYVLPGGMGCPWAGLSTVGGFPSRSWAGGDADVTRHELGHALGMHHSHGLICVQASVCTPGYSVEYGDTFDTMGHGDRGHHFNAIQKTTVLGWLGTTGAPPVTTVTANGTYSLDAYETGGTLPKALRVRLPSGSWYYVEARRAVAEATVNAGVLVHLHEGNADAIYLLDMSPLTPDWGRPALGVGETFRDPSGIGITLTSTSPTGATVTISGLAGPIEPPPPPPPPPPPETVLENSITFNMTTLAFAQPFSVVLGNYECLRVTGGASRLYIYRTVPTRTLLGYVAVSNPVLGPVEADGKRHARFTIRCQDTGTHIKIYLDGTLRLTVVR